jgi:hypothetical protein
MQIDPTSRTQLAKILSMLVTRKAHPRKNKLKPPNQKPRQQEVFSLVLKKKRSKIPKNKLRWY